MSAFNATFDDVKGDLARWDVRNAILIEQHLDDPDRLAELSRAVNATGGAYFVGTWSEIGDLARDGKVIVFPPRDPARAKACRDAVEAWAAA